MLTIRVNGELFHKEGRDATNLVPFSQSPEYATLWERLLDIGGIFVCHPVMEEDLLKILDRGVSYPTEGLRKRKMQRCRCHENSALLWSKLPGSQIVTGYGLSADGLWRAHTWLWQKTRIIETTEVRTQYYGAALTTEEAESFIYSNT